MRPFRFYVYRPDKAGDERRYALDIDYLFTPSGHKYNPNGLTEEKRLREQIEENEFRKRLQKHKRFLIVG